jgi:hypothetical protein
MQLPKIVHITNQTDLQQLAFITTLPKPSVHNQQHTLPHNNYFYSTTKYCNEFTHYAASEFLEQLSSMATCLPVNTVSHRAPLFLYLIYLSPVYGLFNNTVRNSNYTASNCRVNSDHDLASTCSEATVIYKEW